MLRNNKGFSLIELMVVVAIIAILSTIAIPSYQTFQAKARQKEGFALMGGYFAAAQASRTEYGFFPGDYVGTGFNPAGTIMAELTVVDNATALPYGQVQDAACVNLTAAMCDCGGTCTNYMEWTAPAAGMGAVGMALGWIAPAANPAAATATQFTATYSAVVSTKAGMIDEYDINELKTITLITDGLK